MASLLDRPPNFSRPFRTKSSGAPTTSPLPATPAMPGHKLEGRSQSTIQLQPSPPHPQPARHSRVPMRLSKPGPAALRIAKSPIPLRPSTLTPTNSRRPISHIPVAANSHPQPLRSHPTILAINVPPQSRAVTAPTITIPAITVPTKPTPCAGPLSTYHRLKPCGHLVSTAKPTACGSTCSGSTSSGAGVDWHPLIPFACPLCIDSLLGSKYKGKRTAFEAEMAGVKAVLGRPDERDVRLRVLERMWAKERAEDAEALRELGRECEGVPEGQVEK